MPLKCAVLSSSSLEKVAHAQHTSKGAVRNVRQNLLKQTSTACIFVRNSYVAKSEYMYMYLCVCVENSLANKRNVMLHVVLIPRVACKQSVLQGFDQLSWPKAFFVCTCLRQSPPIAIFLCIPTFPPILLYLISHCPLQTYVYSISIRDLLRSQTFPSSLANQLRRWYP
jgi:hypothetical protein